MNTHTTHIQNNVQILGLGHFSAICRKLAHPIIQCVIAVPYITQILLPGPQNDNYRRPYIFPPLLFPPAAPYPSGFPPSRAVVPRFPPCPRNSVPVLNNRRASH